MNRRDFNKMMLAAAGGLAAGAASPALADHHEGKAEAPSDKHECKGKNECKGKGGCKTDANACKGHNECKGKGGCKTKEGHSCAGKNECKGKGGCATGDYAHKPAEPAKK
jgi:hypothetical protein